MRAHSENVSYFCFLNPIQTDRILLRCEDAEQAKTLGAIRGWYKVGPFFVKFSPWSTEAYLKNPKVPSYGGWIKIRNLPID